MSRDASIELTWADDNYTFRLGWSELEALQEACDAGPWVILERLHNKQCRSGEIADVIRQGLIGGGLKPPDATKLVQRYVKERVSDLAENLLFAIAILQTALQGAPDETVGERGAASQEGSNSTASPMEKSDLPPSTETA
ncbi:gene transfer agent family protein [Brucella pituitosa]|uniref:gene transfer agent family protein n=1 Tax=Brucella pituitosa TaxID=571256 RepID=UPI0020065A7D|nr:gene transfer agent family protein [Brucella pituitosa]MCK4205254.1 gene transfer agent family protein [Brucella pituitosa]